MSAVAGRLIVGTPRQQALGRLAQIPLSEWHRRNRATTVAECVARMDPCVVETVALCLLVGDFVTDWLETRRSKRGQRGYDEAEDVDPISPYAWLAFDTSLPEVEIRKIRNPIRYPLAELRVADRIVNSIGEPAMWYDETLAVLPNPLVTDTTRTAECCGGSQTYRSSYAISTSSIIRSSL